jgi:hypothetical protein
LPIAGRSAVFHCMQAASSASAIPYRTGMQAEKGSPRRAALRPLL